MSRRSVLLGDVMCNDFYFQEKEITLNVVRLM